MRRLREELWPEGMPRSQDSQDYLDRPFGLSELLRTAVSARTNSEPDKETRNSSGEL